MIPRTRTRNLKSKGSAARNLLFLILLFDVVAVLAHLWGRVQIDFSMRRNQKLLDRKHRVQAEIDGLSAELDNLKSYQRIASLAKAQGLQFVSSDRLEDLPVDMRGLRRPDFHEEGGVALAGIGAFHRPPALDEIRVGENDVR